MTSCTVCDALIPQSPSQFTKIPPRYCEACFEAFLRRYRKHRAAQRVNLKCKECRWTGDLIALDFNHKRDKRYNISHMTTKLFSWEKIASEIVKCELLCAICHRKHHHPPFSKSLMLKIAAELDSVGCDDLDLLEKTAAYAKAYVQPENCQHKRATLRPRAMKLLAFVYKGASCIGCGLKDENLAVYDFHHIDTKEFNISQILRKSWPIVKSELDKCILLCCRCHRLEHAIVRPTIFYTEFTKFVQLMKKHRKLIDDSFLERYLNYYDFETKFNANEYLGKP